MATDLEGAVELVARAVQTRMAGARRDAARNNLGTKLTDEMVRDAAESATVGGLPVLALSAILDALASITRERDAMREAGKPFFDLAKTVTTPTPGSPPWWQESQDWTVVFSFAGCSVTLGDLRRAAALVNGEGGK